MSELQSLASDKIFSQLWLIQIPLQSLIFEQKNCFMLKATLINQL